MFKLIKVKNEKRKVLSFKLSVFEKRIILNEIFFSKNYFPKINKEQDFGIGEKDIVIDIGAHVGIFSIYVASMAKKGKVYAFEPVKKNFKRLEYHKHLNKLDNLTLVNKCVSDKNKRVKIYLAQKNTGGHSLNRNKFKSLREVVRGSEIVDCITLKSIFDTYKIQTCNFLKLDCEGEEAHILKALPRDYFKKIDKIVLEFHHPIVNEIKLAEYLAKQGYRVTINNVGSTLGMIFAKKKVKR